MGKGCVSRESKAQTDRGAKYNVRLRGDSVTLLFGPEGSHLPQQGVSRGASGLVQFTSSAP